MIKGFRHKGLKRFYERGDPRGILSNQVRKISILLAALDDARGLDDLKRPSFRLHPLTGDRKGEWSFKVNGPWRITFTFEDSGPDNVNLEQYH